MFNGGTRKRMLAAAIGTNSPGMGVEGNHHTNNRSKLLEQSLVSHNRDPSSCTSMAHNAAAAAAAAVAGRASLAAARAACAAACSSRTSSSPNLKDRSINEGYEEIYDTHNHEGKKVFLLPTKSKVTKFISCCIILPKS